ncbi:NAD(P)-binding protein [Coniophora puteana RWD-64-598 SS2]|uniref:NAD(P)-binding protein n=1 Tax=Coniophora puteana (strain RWD-64-598) TaxID=741705 RepID=A0A5M3MDA0_CONPW|nr:NAD(P)-binding protein [Coniophora puteana RWD-64-598 SS2]EIW76605.1 NAD(P)-binding protein [Coniophora puteana RWD-64-598 SS2]
MSLPQSIREYRSNGDGYQNIKLVRSSIEPPNSTEVIIKVHAVSLQYRDLMVSMSKYPGAKPNVVVGSDAAGEIVAVGQDVKGWKVGDRVSPNFSLDHLDGDTSPKIFGTSLGAPTDGVLREYIKVPAHSLVRIPEHLSYEEGSTLPCAALTAYNALHGPKPLKGGDTVLILGTGGVSTFGLQFAVASGAEVIVTSSSDEKLKVARQLGAHHTINYKTNPDWDKEVLKITGGRGVDHTIEVGGPGTVHKSGNATRMAGYIHIIGFVASGDNAIPIPALVHTAKIYRGILIGSVAQFESMNRLIKTKKIKPVVDKVFPFEQTIQAYSYLESQQHVGKVVIKVSKD